ncbi:MAG: hypothetical protein H0U59_11850 [Gemmatimonadaceae bacterium]|nr:hypothetical protein [Gemmatimonadaceae bacterium]
MNNQQAVDAFLARKPGGSTNIHSAGGVLYSYAEPIAVRHFDGTILFSDAVGPRMFSVTTSGHIGRVKRSAEFGGFAVREIAHKTLISGIER